MSSILDNAVDISELGHRHLVVLWGKSGSGKTELGSTFPKPMLYLRVGDDGSNTIADKEGIKGLPIETISDLKDALKTLIKRKGAKYASVFVDTYSMITNVWVKENVIDKNKKMTQQLWGDLKTETEEITRLAHELAEHCWVLLSCHETIDSFEGMDDEILPDVRPSVTKGARTYLEGMANYGFHTTKLQKTVIKDGKEVTLTRFAAHIGANPYYWTKLQISKDIKVPPIIYNPTFDKVQEILGIT